MLELQGALKPDMASSTLGSMNFMNTASVNSPQKIRDLARKMRDNGIKPELEVFDVGTVNFAKFLIERNELEPPFYFNILLGNVASAQASIVELAPILTALPEGALRSLGGLGRHQLPMNALSVALGGGGRVGLEDNVWLDDERALPACNRALVRRVADIAALQGRAVMAPAGFRTLLGLQDRL